MRLPANFTPDYLVARDVQRLRCHCRRAKTYAMRLISQPGTHDGLAWNNNGKPFGPMGRLAAIALAQGYRAPTALTGVSDEKRSVGAL